MSVRAHATKPAAPPPTRGADTKRIDRVARLLCEQGVITDSQLETAIAHQRASSPEKPIERVLVELSMASEERVTQALAEAVGTPFARLSPDMVQPEAMCGLPSEFVETHNLLPISMVEGWLTIVVEQFANVYLIEEIGRRAGCQVQVLAATPENIRETRRALAGGGAPQRSDSPATFEREFDGILGQISVDELVVVGTDADLDEPDLEASASASDSPIVKLVNYVIKRAVEAGASDIHIEPDGTTFRVRCRVDGELVESVRPSARLLPAVVSRVKIMAGMDISERRLPQDGGMTVTLANRPIDLRVSTMTTKFGEKVVMRVVDREAGVRGLEAMGFSEDMLKRFRAAFNAADGIVLVTGPTGSGKTTTLYGALSEIVSTKHNISTIEDPVERRLAGANQFQVNAAAGFTFAKALRSMLRQDPDVIMVGEIRDTETARLATEAALTGHLVLSTLHTNDAPTAVPRLLNMGVEPYLVAASLRAVLAQRLVRAVCPHCRKDVPLTPAQHETLTQLCGGTCPVEMSPAGAGCAKCRQTGCSGRVGVFELLQLNEEMLTTMTRDPSTSGLRGAMRSLGMPTLLQDGVEKVRRGLIGVAGLLEIVSGVEEPTTAGGREAA